MGYKRVKPKVVPGHKRVKPKVEPGYKSFKKKGSKTKIFGKTEEQWGETLRGAKKGVKEYYSKENRKARRKKRLENKSERIDSRIAKRKRVTEDMEKKNKTRKEEASKMKHGGSIGTSVKTYSSGGYVEGK